MSSSSSGACEDDMLTQDFKCRLESIRDCPKRNGWIVNTKGKIQVDLKFALPGKERQDSVYTVDFRCMDIAVDLNSEFVCIHDSARSLVSSEDVKKVMKDSLSVGAAVLGVPAKATIKEANSESFAVKTLDRKTLWEMQTPQVIKPELLKKGIEFVNRGGLEVTTPDDLLLAERILNTASAVAAYCNDAWGTYVVERLAYGFFCVHRKEWENRENMSREASDLKWSTVPYGALRSFPSGDVA
ncbi:hypothetical protein LguiA_026852 [Lonicera macranthoides]